ncbi:TerC family protein [Opitutus sp. GAS368]|uniref:TerC family protein n=1 Tax=Opitutus sp. GAS368 TaxID=1882749 RepID=UPI00087B0887|nr:TerC family protein [Opitutus sp. GAS368]SDS03951.1 integral membrane protein, YjbE family [Opitutus sp. GAS368]
MTDTLAVVTSTANLNTPIDWLLAILSIVLIDIVLAGDNAVVIALAVRRLKGRERLWGTVIGSGMAVVLRVGLTFVASQLLAISYVKLIGGLLILWIAVKLLVDNTGGEEGKGEAQNLWQAVWLITVADITMSLDNVLAVAGASKGSFGLLLFGLGLSIPLVVFTSNLLARLMDRYPVVIYVGSAILGKVGGDMIMTDRLVADAFHPEPWLVHTVEGLLALGVILLALVWRKARKKNDAV